MKKAFSFTHTWMGLFVLIGAISVSIMQDDGSNNRGGNYTRLSPVDVLAIIARPLPSDVDRGYYLAGADITNVFLENVQLERAILRRADLSNSVLTDANLRGADLSGATLHGTQLWFADLSVTNLVSADLTGADLFQSRLADAVLDGAIIKGVDFTDSYLENTILPDGSTYEIGDDLVARFGASKNP